MINTGLVFDIIGYSVVLFISIYVPYIIYKKTSIIRAIASVISIFLTILLINLLFFLSAKFNVKTHPFFYEFHEVIWILPPIIVFFLCKEGRKLHKGA